MSNVAVVPALRPGPGRPARHALACGVVLGFALSAATTAGAAAAPPAPTTRDAADRLASSPPSPARDAQLVTWARAASLDDLLWVLRRPPAELARAEAPLVASALRRAPSVRADLRRRLETRGLLADPAAARRAGREPAELRALNPRASVFRIGVLLPDRGDYAGYADAVRGGLAAGLEWRRPPGAVRIELDARGTGEGEVARAAYALDSLAWGCAAVVGELLSVPTTALAAATRVLGMPLVSPTATDEEIGRIGLNVFQVGPASAQRGERLARAIVTPGGRKLAVVSAGHLGRGHFLRAFTAAAESLGARVVRTDSYAPGAVDFRTIAKGIKLSGAELLFWDGESREADALLRQLAMEGASVRLCGGAALAPEQFHAASRTLLEGVTWVADEWRLPAPEQSALDSLARARGDKPSMLWVRGYLAGRRLADAVDAGALTPAELAAELRHEDAALRERGFLNCTRDGAHLPVFTIQRGRTVEVAAR